VAQIKEQGGTALFVACDVGDTKAVDALFDQAVRECGRYVVGHGLVIDGGQSVQ